MRTVAEYLEKAEAFEVLAAAASDELLRTSYRDLAHGYRNLAEQRRAFLADRAGET
jgi:hypothetical protein